MTPAHEGEPNPAKTEEPAMDEPQTRMTDVEVVALIIEKYHPRMSPLQAIVEANAIVAELRSARTRSVEPPREMSERARSFFVTCHNAAHIDCLAAEFTAIRTQAIEECAGVADKDGVHCPDESYEAACQNIAAGIRGFL